MNEAFYKLLAGAGQNAEGLLPAEELESWTTEDVDLLILHHVLRPASPAQVVECPGCEEACLMPVHVLPGQGERPPRIFVACDRRDDTSIIPIEPKALHQWQLDLPGFVSLLAEFLETGKTPEEILPQQAYFLGTATINRKKRSALYVCDRETLNSLIEDGLFREFQDPFFLVAGSIRGPVGGGKEQGIPLSQILVSSIDSISLNIDMLQSFLETHNVHQTDETAPIVSDIEHNIFRKQGQKWVIRYKKGQVYFLNDNKGFLYISYLLGCPGREFHCQQLVTYSSGVNLEDIFGDKGVQSFEESKEFDISDNNNPIIDKEALQNYKDRIYYLRNEIETAKKNKDISKKESLQIEYKFIRKEVISASSIDGKIRELNDDSEKHRKAVSAACRRSLKIIKNEDGLLYKHLQNSLHFGVFCSYQPEEEIYWKISKK